MSDLNLLYTLDTHVHADHITGSGNLREQTGALSVLSEAAEVECVDRRVNDGDRLGFGSFEVEVRSTPGHTNSCVSYVIKNNDQTMAFTGDALLIRGNGRTDFQQGDSKTLFKSVHRQIFSLPEDTVIYPGHDYRGHSSSTVAEEKAHNPRLNTGVREVQFMEIMDNLNLSNPKMMDVAVPANLSCGKTIFKDSSISKIEELVPEKGVDFKKYRVIDVRQPEEFFGELGHINGAELVPLTTLQTAIEFWPKKEPILVVCRSGVRAFSACNELISMGFTKVTNLKGGMLAWNNTCGMGLAGGQS